MRSLKVACLVAFVIIGFARPTDAATISWTAVLDGTQVFPVPTGSTATGNGLITFDDTTNILSVDLNYQGLTGNAERGDIHCCVTTPPGQVGIALNLWLAPLPSSGSLSFLYDLDLVNPFTAAFTSANSGTALSAFAALMAAMDADQGRAYFRIATATFPAGEIRGNIAPVVSEVVPEPATLSLLGLGLAGAAVRRFRRRRL